MVFDQDVVLEGNPTLLLETGVFNQEVTNCPQNDTARLADLDHCPLPGRGTLTTSACSRKFWQIIKAKDPSYSDGITVLSINIKPLRPIAKVVHNPGLFVYSSHADSGPDV